MVITVITDSVITVITDSADTGSAGSMVMDITATIERVCTSNDTLHAGAT